jgi:hypothetical protein
MNTTEIYKAASKHCDQTICNRSRAVLGWNFSNEGLRAFAEEIKTPAVDYPECTGNPANCPENEGCGCCGN